MPQWFLQYSHSSEGFIDGFHKGSRFTIVQTVAISPRKYTMSRWYLCDICGEAMVDNGIHRRLTLVKTRKVNGDTITKLSECQSDIHAISQWFGQHCSDIIRHNYILLYIHFLQDDITNYCKAVLLFDKRSSQLNCVINLNLLSHCGTKN